MDTRKGKQKNGTRIEPMMRPYPAWLRDAVDDLTRQARAARRASDRAALMRSVSTARCVGRLSGDQCNQSNGRQSRAIDNGLPESARAPLTADRRPLPHMLPAFVLMRQPHDGLLSGWPPPRSPRMHEPSPSHSTFERRICGPRFVGLYLTAHSGQLPQLAVSDSLKRSREGATVASSSGAGAPRASIRDGFRSRRSASFNPVGAFTTDNG